MPETITQAEKILLRVPNWVGEAVFCLPAVEKLRERFPPAELTVLAQPPVAQLFRMRPEVNRVLAFDFRGHRRDLLGLLRLARELRSQRFDLAVLFHNSFQAALLAFLAGIPRRLGYARDARRPLLTHPIPFPKPGELTVVHEGYKYLELLHRAGWLSALPVLERIPLQPPAPAVERMRQRLREHGLEEEEKGSRRLRVVLTPGSAPANGLAKRWLPERYAALADRLVEEYGAVVLLCGAPAEVSVGQEVVARMRTRPLWMIGDTLEDFVALLPLVDLIISNDSGAMHLAAGLGLPQVVIYGPTKEFTTGPFNPRARAVRHPVSCSPCQLGNCPVDHRCMTRLTVDEAWAAVEAALADARPAAHAHP